MILSCAAIAAGLFFYGVRIDPEAKKPAMPGAMQESMRQQVDSTAAIKKLFSLLPEKSRDSANQLTKVLAGKFSEKTCLELSQIFANNNQPIGAAEYRRKIALHTNEAKQWRSVANAYLIGFAQAKDSSLHFYSAQRAAESYAKLLSIDSTDTDARLNYAAILVEGMNDVMSGVKQLKKITAKDPDNPDANLMLGRLDVMSGQNEKAVPRLEKLIKNHPEMTEAYFHLAEAYRAQGKKEKAIELLTQCKLQIKDAATVADLEHYISQIKNSN